MTKLLDTFVGIVLRQVLHSERPISISQYIARLIEVAFPSQMKVHSLDNKGSLVGVSNLESPFTVQTPTRIPETSIPEFTTIPEKRPTTEVFIY